MRRFSAIGTLWSFFLVSLLLGIWAFISRVRTFIFGVLIWIILFHLFLSFGFEIFAFKRCKHMILKVLRVSIWISLTFSWVRESMNASRDGILQFRTLILVAWNVDTKTEYFRPKFDRMERINCSSLFSIPHCLRKSTSDLNLVMNSSMISNSLGLNEINSFSNWCPLRSSFFPKRDSSLIHT